MNKTIQENEILKGELVSKSAVLEKTQTIVAKLEAEVTTAVAVNKYLEMINSQQTKICMLQTDSLQKTVENKMIEINNLLEELQTKSAEINNLKSKIETMNTNM